MRLNNPSFPNPSLFPSFPNPSFPPVTRHIFPHLCRGVVRHFPNPCIAGQPEPASPARLPSAKGNGSQKKVSMSKRGAGDDANSVPQATAVGREGAQDLAHGAGDVALPFCLRAMTRDSRTRRPPMARTRQSRTRAIPEPVIPAPVGRTAFPHPSFP